MGAAQSSMRPAGMVLPVSYLGELGSEIQYEKRCVLRVNSDGEGNRAATAQRQDAIRNSRS